MEYKVKVKLKELDNVLDSLRELGYSTTYDTSIVTKGIIEDIREWCSKAEVNKIWLYIYTENKEILWDSVKTSGKKIKVKEIQEVFGK